MKRAATLMVALLFSFAVAGCASEPGPEDAVESFANEAAEFDITGMLECCSQSTNDIITAMNDFTNGLLGLAGVGPIDAKALASGLLPFLFEYAEASGQEIQIDIAAESLSTDFIDDEHAVVTGTWVFSVSVDGQMESGEEPFELDLVKEDGVWKIDFTDQLFEALQPMF